MFAANVFAILGLRALYFCLAAMADRFRYLNRGLGVILAFVGVKLTVINLGIKIDPILSLVVVTGILTVAILASWLRPAPPEVEGHPDLPWPTDDPDGGSGSAAAAVGPGGDARPS